MFKAINSVIRRGHGTADRLCHGQKRTLIPSLLILKRACGEAEVIDTIPEKIAVCTLSTSTGRTPRQIPVPESLRAVRNGTKGLQKLPVCATFGHSFVVSGAHRTLPSGRQEAVFVCDALAIGQPGFRRHFMKILTIVILSCLAALAGASNTSADDSKAVGRDFDAAIAPILARRCLDCHSGSDPKGKLDLSKKASALAGGDERPGDRRRQARREPALGKSRVGRDAPQVAAARGGESGPARLDRRRGNLGY